MIIKLRNGLTLSLPEGSPAEFSKTTGYFILDGRPCSEPDLSITPALYATCEDTSQVYELYEYEFVLGTGADIE